MGYEDRPNFEGQNQQEGPATESPFNAMDLFRDGPLAVWRTRNNDAADRTSKTTTNSSDQSLPRRMSAGPETPAPIVVMPEGDSNVPRPMPSVRIEGPATATPPPARRAETPQVPGQTVEPPLANPARPGEKPQMPRPAVEIVRPVEQVISRLQQSGDPVSDVSGALDKISDLKFAGVTRLAADWHHVEGNLEATQVSAPPRVRGMFRPQESRVETNFSFDLRNTNNGALRLENMTGFTGNARGPLGRLRETETTSMTLGRDQHGPYLRTESSVHFRRNSLSGSHTLREANFPVGSPLRTVMNQPEAVKNITGALSLFQNTEDVNRVSIRKVGEGSFDVSAEADNTKHIEINQRLESGALVRSIDLEKALTARISRQRDSVGLENIKGMKVNVELGPLKMTLEPTKVSLARGNDGKPVVRIELRTPQGAVLPLEVPMEKLIAARNRK